MTNPHRSNPFADLGYDDPFADERVKLAEVLFLRAEYLGSLGLVIPERVPIDVLRRDLGMRHVGQAA